MPKKILPSIGGKKLMKLGVTLPPIPVCSVGSLPKQAELTELRYKVAKKVQQPLELDRKEKLSTEVWVRQQERAGMDVLVDGQMDRGDMIQFFAGKMNGFSEGGTVRCYGNRYYRKPIITGKVEWRGPITLDYWRYAQRLTHKVVKAVITGPYTLLDWSFNEHYTSREEALADITAALRKEVLALVEAGAKVIQIDEPALSSNPNEFPLIQKAINELTENVRSYFILFHAFGDAAPLWPKMERLHVDNFHFDMANSDFALLAALKKTKTKKDLSFGVVDSHNHHVETPKELDARIKKSIGAVPLNQLWLSTDAGLKTRTIDEAIAKMKALSTATTKRRPATK